MFTSSILAAIIPTAFLIWLIWWADRYEREPTRLLIAAFVWGALPSILLALLVEVMAAAPFDGGGLSDALVQNAVIAPVVEELVKGLALLGLLRFSHTEIDGVLDGVIYGALVGAGFAMTENFFYFMSSAGTDSWGIIVILRSFAFGLNHILYTAIFGATVGYAMRLNDKNARRGIMLLGMAVAIVAHAFHNFAVTLTDAFPPLFVLTLLMNWGGALVMLLIVLASLQRERNSIRDYLNSPEAATLTPEDHRRLLSIIPPRQRFLPDFPWLSPARRRENQLYQAVAEIALRRQRLSGRSDAEKQHLAQEITGLQKQIEGLAMARQKDADGNHHPA